jgi:hypothetical protein
MDAKTAYCYLNCTQSANCCGTCGECPDCCEDCPTNYSNFSDTAYFKDGNFYKNFTSTHSSFRSENWSDTSTHKLDSTNITSTYKSKENRCLVNGSSYRVVSFDDGDQTVTSASYSGTSAYGCGCDTNDDCFLGGRCVGPNGDAYPCCGSFTPSCGTCEDDTCPTFNPGCSGLECVCSEEEIANGDCEGSYSVSSSAKITFEDTVQLYNSRGEVVDPSFIGASYDPCNPCATWSAACHFFHP